MRNPNVLATLVNLAAVVAAAAAAFPGAVKLETTFLPMDLNSLDRVKTMKELGEDFDDSNPGSLKGLVEWTRAAADGGELADEAFQGLLPPDDIQVGDSWSLYDFPEEIIDPSLDPSTLSTDHTIPRHPNGSFVYFPPSPSPSEFLIHSLLLLFHPRPFTRARFGPRGARAILLARDAARIDVLFRVHAEFQLNLPPTAPFWLTPAQFVGRMIGDVSSLSFSVLHFHFFLPAFSPLNVDMEWMNPHSSVDNQLDVDSHLNEVDISFIPQMEVVSATASNDSRMATSVAENLDFRLPFDLTNFAADKVVVSSAVDALAKAFYPFKSVEYLDLDSAVARASLLAKPVHAILLWGSLDDQSC